MLILKNLGIYYLLTQTNKTSPYSQSRINGKLNTSSRFPSWTKSNDVRFKLLLLILSTPTTFARHQAASTPLFSLTLCWIDILTSNSGFSMNFFIIEFTWRLFNPSNLALEISSINCFFLCSTITFLSSRRMISAATLTWFWGILKAFKTSTKFSNSFRQER